MAKIETSKQKYATENTNQGNSLSLLLHSSLLMQSIPTSDLQKVLQICARKPHVRSDKSQLFWALSMGISPGGPVHPFT